MPPYHQPDPEPATVVLCSPTNSTTFTTCCEVAICDDQGVCPRCRAEILPKTGRWREAYDRARRGRYGNPFPLRAAQARKG